MGQKAIEAARILVAELELDDQLSPEEFLSQREALLDELFLTSALLPGAERLLRHLRAHGVPAALATSSHRRHYELKATLHAQLFGEAFDHIVTGACAGGHFCPLFLFYSGSPRRAAVIAAWSAQMRHRPPAVGGCCRSQATK